MFDVFLCPNASNQLWRPYGSERETNFQMFKYTISYYILTVDITKHNKQLGHFKWRIKPTLLLISYKKKKNDAHHFSHTSINDLVAWGGAWSNFSFYSVQDCRLGTRSVDCFLVRKWGKGGRQTVRKHRVGKQHQGKFWQTATARHALIHQMGRHQSTWSPVF